MELTFLGSIPSLLTILFAVLYLVPKHMSGLSNVMPLLPLLPVFYWGISQARAIPYWFIFLIGLVTDSVTGLPLGLSALLYMLFLSLIYAQRKFMHKEGFLVKWSYFAALLGVLTFLNWLLLSWYHAQAMPFMSAAMQWLLTIACYPVAHRLFDLLEQHIHNRKWEILHG